MMDSTMCTAGNHRKLRVTAQPNVSLTLEHVPRHCRRAKTILLGPLTPTDLDAAAFVHQEHGALAIMSLERDTTCILCTTSHNTAMLSKLTCKALGRFLQAMQVAALSILID